MVGLIRTTYLFLSSIGIDMLASPIHVRLSAVLAAVALLAFLVPQASHAEQQVVLNSGTVLRGTATLEEGKVKVVVGDSTLEVPIADVKSIDVLDEDEKRSAARLLQAALEQGASEGRAKLDYRLLAEARRLDPDSIPIAFWYAFALAEQGQWEGAKEIYSANQEQFAKTYPGLAADLEGRINERVADGKLPEPLRIRLETIEKQKPVSISDLQSLQSTYYYSLFRLIDQNGKPLAQSDFHIDQNRNDNQLESFEGGYYLFKHEVRNNYSSSTAPTLRITKPGFAPFDFQITGTPFDVRKYGDLVVQRLDDSDKKELTVRVTSGSKPLSNVLITIRPQIRTGGATNEQQELRTDDKGEVTTKLFPFEYMVNGSKAKFTMASASIRPDQLKATMDPIELSMYPQLTGSIVTFYGGEDDDWKPSQSTIDFPVSGRQQFPQEFGFYPIQVRDQLQVSINSNNAQIQNGQIYKVKGSLSSDDFDGIKLEEIEKIIKSDDATRFQDIRMRASMEKGLEEGDVLLGFVDLVDHQTRTSKRNYFKVRVDSLKSTAADLDEPEQEATEP